VGGRAPSRYPAGDASIAERRRKIRRGLAKDFIRLAQFPNLTFKGFDPVAFIACHTIAQAAVFFCLHHPPAQCLRNTAYLWGNCRNRSGLRFIRTLVLKHHPNRARPNLGSVAICHFAFCHNHHPYLS